MKLSILTAALPERASLYWERINSLNLPKDEVEVLALADNRALTGQAKWQMLLDVCRGEYMMYLDDDDELLPEFWPEIKEAIKEKPDVITFLQDARFNGKSFLVEMRCDNPMEELNHNGVTRRKPLANNTVYRTEFARQAKHGDPNEEHWASDSLWASQLWSLPKKEIHIPKILHRYNYEDTFSSVTPIDKSQQKRVCVVTFEGNGNIPALVESVRNVGLQCDFIVYSQYLDRNANGIPYRRIPPEWIGSMAGAFFNAIKEGYEQVIWIDDRVRVIRHPRLFLEYAHANWWTLWEHSDNVVIADLTHEHVREAIQVWHDRRVYREPFNREPFSFRDIIKAQIVGPLPYGGLCNNPDHLSGQYASYFVDYGSTSNNA